MSRTVKPLFTLFLALLIALPASALADDMQEIVSSPIDQFAEEVEVVLLDGNSAEELPQEPTEEIPEDIDGDTAPVVAAEIPDMPFNQTVDALGAAFTVSADVRVFPNGASLCVEAVENAAFVEAVEAAIGVEGEYVHRLCRVAAVDAVGNAIQPDLSRGIPLAYVEGLNLPADTRVALYDAGEQAVHIIESSVDAGNVAFSLAEMTVYDIVSFEPVWVDAEDIGEEPPFDIPEPDVTVPAEEPAGEPVEAPVEETVEAAPVEPVEEARQAVVTFDIFPAAAEISVRPAGNAEGLALESIPAQEDGTFLLPPGAYLYAASAAGYAPVEGAPLTIGAFDQNVTVFFALEAMEEPADRVAVEKSAPADDATVIEVGNGFVETITYDDAGIRALFRIRSNVTYYGMSLVPYLEKLTSIEIALTDGSTYAIPMTTTVRRDADRINFTAALSYDAAYEISRMCDAAADLESAKLICHGSSFGLDSAGLNDLLTSAFGMPIDFMTEIRRVAALAESAAFGA